MAAPAYGSAGNAAGAAATSINVPHPAGIQAGDILLLLVLTKDNVEINLPAGWSQDATNGARNQSTLLRAEWFWKRALGNESGNLAVSKVSGTTLLYGRMYRFTGCVDSGTPYEAAEQAGLTSSATLTPADITTLGHDRLIVCLTAVGDNNAVGDYTGGSATMPQVIAEATTAAGTDGCLGCCALARTVPETFDFGTFVMAASDMHALFTFALLPAEEQVPTVSAPGVTFDVKRHPITLEARKITWANTSGFPATLSLHNAAGTQTIPVSALQSAEIACNAGYIWDEAQAGLNINIRYQ